jgi:hypothetical protein
MIDERDRSRLADMLSYARDALELLGETAPPVWLGTRCDATP